MDLLSHVEYVVPSKYGFKALSKKIHSPSLTNLYKLMILKGSILHKESPRDESFESNNIYVQFPLPHLVEVHRQRTFVSGHW